MSSSLAGSATSNAAFLSPFLTICFLLSPTRFHLLRALHQTPSFFSLAYTPPSPLLSHQCPTLQ